MYKKTQIGLHGSRRSPPRSWRRTAATAVVTIGSLLKPFFGLRERAHQGVIYRKRLANGLLLALGAEGRLGARFKALCEDSDFENVLIDGTLVRVHQHGTGLKIKP